MLRISFWKSNKTNYSSLGRNIVFFLFVCLRKEGTLKNKQVSDFELGIKKAYFSSILPSVWLRYTFTCLRKSRLKDCIKSLVDIPFQMKQCTFL